MTLYAASVIFRSGGHILSGPATPGPGIPASPTGGDNIHLLPSSPGPESRSGPGEIYGGGVLKDISLINMFEIDEDEIESEVEEVESDFFEEADNQTKREKTIIEMRYGIGAHKEQTLEEINKYFHLTRESIRQIEEKALQRLKQPNRISLLIDFRKEYLGE